MRIAIMQPYVFSYVGYFQLIEAVEAFVFYDDVHFIKQGWINRNRILNENEPLLFTVPLQKASPNRLILETVPQIDASWRNKFARRLQHCYHKAPYFCEVFDLVMAVFEDEYPNVADLSIASIRSVYTHLGRTIDYVKSSEVSPETRGIDRADRLISICHKLNATHYVNSSGGRELYSKENFEAKGITLSFLESHFVEYRQFFHPFVPWLSVIDVMMFNSREELKDIFSAYHLS